MCVFLLFLSRKEALGKATNFIQLFSPHTHISFTLSIFSISISILLFAIFPFLHFLRFALWVIPTYLAKNSLGGAVKHQRKRGASCLHPLSPFTSQFAGVTTPLGACSRGCLLLVKFHAYTYVYQPNNS